MSNIRRINILGGPGCGKTTIASGLFYRMRTSIWRKLEIVNEYIKENAIEGITPKGFDELYVFSKQIRAEDRRLRNRVPYLISECPLILCCAYAKKYNFVSFREMLAITKHFEEEYPSLNIFLDRKDLPYITEGRYQDLEQAIEMDKIILDMASEIGDPKLLHIVPATRLDEVLEIVNLHLSEFPS